MLCPHFINALLILNKLIEAFNIHSHNRTNINCEDTLSPKGFNLIADIILISISRRSDFINMHV